MVSSLDIITVVADPSKVKFKKKIMYAIQKYILLVSLHSKTQPKDYID